MIYKEINNNFIIASRAYFLQMYRSVVGSLRYLVHTRPNLAYSVGVVSHFMEKPATEHMSAVKQILCYVKALLILAACTERERKD